MANDRTYPRADNEYPEIMSKMDPLIIRVSPTVLLVGSTSYTAKVKMGQLFNGYYVYVSGVGLPILKQEVDISTESTTDASSNSGEGSDAWNYIQDSARDWLDDLEQSMIKDSTEKNIVQLLREIKFQMHYDLSGHTANADDYGATLEFCKEDPTYIQNILKQLELLNEKLDILNSAISGEDGLNSRVSKVEQQVSNVKDSVDSLSSNVGDKLETTNTNLGNIHDDIDGIKTTLTKNSESLGSTISEAITDGLQSLVAQMNTMNSNITAIDGKIGTVNSGYYYDTTSDTLFGRINKVEESIGDKSRQNSLWSDVGKLSNDIGAIKSDVGTLGDSPILKMDGSHVDWLNYWVQDVYDDTGEYSDRQWFGKIKALLEDTLAKGTVGSGVGLDGTQWGPAWGLKVLTGWT